MVVGLGRMRSVRVCSVGAVKSSMWVQPVSTTTAHLYRHGACVPFAQPCDTDGVVA